MKFAKRGDIVDPKAQNFAKEEITITKHGQTYNLYDAIQAANVDTDIYEVMKKYNLREDEAVTWLQERGGVKGLFADIAEIQERCQTLGDLIELKRHADELYNNLPADVKQKFGNNLEDFFKQATENIKLKPEATKTNEPEGANNDANQ